ncbi:MAG: universal stress protein [Chloroflexi bacterium]|nr:universal stress protein [Chloroflexota bacterium]
MLFERILVPVKGDKTDREVVELACSLASKKKGVVFAVYVIEVKRALPLDAEIEPEIQKGEKILEQVDMLAQEKECRIETELLQAREVGPALVDEAAEKNVALIIIGLGYKKRFGEFSLGSIAPYILKNAPCRVLVYREPVQGET